MNISRRHLLILLPAAAVAWKFVEAGTPEASPNYQMSEHWWGMLINIPKCIGCGNCVRACANGERRARWQLPHLGRALSRHGHGNDHARGDLARRRQGRFSGSPGGRGQVLLRPQNVQPLRRFALHAGVPGGRHVHQPRRRGADRSKPTAWVARIACRPARMAAATFIPPSTWPTNARCAITASPRG